MFCSAGVDSSWIGKQLILARRLIRHISSHCFLLTYLLFSSLIDDRLLSSLVPSMHGGCIYRSVMGGSTDPAGHPFGKLPTVTALTMINDNDNDNDSDSDSNSDSDSDSGSGSDNDSDSDSDSDYANGNGNDNDATATSAVEYKKEWDGRIECSCKTCKRQLGHAFPDGPRRIDLPEELLEEIPENDLKMSDPNYVYTRLPRYCINGASLKYH